MKKISSCKRGDIILYEEKERIVDFIFQSKDPRNGNDFVIEFLHESPIYIDGNLMVKEIECKN
jgi:hypothetical protein